MGRSYRVARRAFLGAIAGAAGLKVLLRNLEAAAEGGAPPPRFVLAHWPNGTLRHRFLPVGSGADYVTSPILQPFEDAGLRGNMTVFWGFSDGHLRCPGGGGVEAGTPFTTTGCSSPGTRANTGELDDAVAGGPSFDQVFLRHVPALQVAGSGYANAICDARAMSYETSTRCLSYGYETREIPAAREELGLIRENVPLLPTPEPAKLYAQLFGQLMPGGATPGNQDKALLALKLRKSVLDHATEELARLKELAPHSEREKIDLHAQSVRELERQLQGAITPIEVCRPPLAPAADLAGKSGDRTSPQTREDDTDQFLAVIEAHQAVLLAALQCDLTRVATFQFAPGQNLVGHRGLWPGDSTRVATQLEASRSPFILGGGAKADPSGLTETEREQYDFLANVYTWYNQRLAKWLAQLAAAPDLFGGNLLDTTIVPYVTEVADPSSNRSPKPALLFGGKKLGLQHGSFMNFSGATRPQVDLFLTCAQALLRTPDPLAALAGESLLSFNPIGAPIPALWKPV